MLQSDELEQVVNSVATELEQRKVRTMQENARQLIKTIRELKEFLEERLDGHYQKYKQLPKVLIPKNKGAHKGRFRPVRRLGFKDLHSLQEYQLGNGSRGVATFKSRQKWYSISTQRIWNLFPYHARLGEAVKKPEIWRECTVANSNKSDS